MFLRSFLPTQAVCAKTRKESTGSGTRELDHILAMSFQFWDVVLRGRTRFVPGAPPSETLPEAENSPPENPDN